MLSERLPLQFIDGPDDGGKQPLLYGTKASPLLPFFHPERRPVGPAMFIRFGWPTDGQWEMVAARARRSRNVIRYVADLDPCDLATWVELCFRGNACGVSVIPMDYGIVLRGHRMIREAAIDMEPEETALHRRLMEMSIDWESVIGPEAILLLDGGRKIELEGMCGPICGERERRLFRKAVIG